MLNFFETLIFGLVSGVTDILPVSAEAHKLILLKLFGEETEPALLRLVIHIAVLAALYYGCRNQIIRFTRQSRLARLPKSRRRRPVDTRTILDLRLLKITLIPVLIGFGIYFKTAPWGDSLAKISAFLVLNGIIMFVPSLLPAGNKDSRALSRVDGLLIGAGAALRAIPGFSAVGCAATAAQLRGADRGYAVNTALLVQMGVTAGLIIHDFVAVFTMGVSTLTFGAVAGFLAAAVLAFAGAFFAVRFLRAASLHIGLDVFAYYCWGAAFFAFILYLSV